MKARRLRTEITVETHQMVIVRRERFTRFWCEQCGREAEFVPLSEVNRLPENPVKEAGERYRTGTPHLATATDGSVVACIRSLLLGH